MSNQTACLLRLNTALHLGYMDDLTLCGVVKTIYKVSLECHPEKHAADLLEVREKKLESKILCADFRFLSPVTLISLLPLSDQ